MKVRRTSAAILIALAFSFVLPIGAQASTTPTQFRFRSVLTDGGLPANKVRSITQDAQGFLWIATLGGLSRWDGVEAITYTGDPSGQAALPHFTVTSVAPDPQRGVWAAARELIYVDPWASEVERLNVEADIVAADDQYVWAISSSEITRVDMRDRSTQVVWSGPLAKDGGQDMQAVVDKDSVLYVVVESGVHVIDDTDAHFVSLPPHTYGLAVRSDGGAWATSNDAIWRIYRRRGNTAEPVDLSARVPEAGTFDASGGIHQNRSGVVWIARSDGGIERYDPARQIWSFVPAGPQSGLESGPLEQLYEDDSGGWWGVPVRGGLVRGAPLENEVATLTPLDRADGPALRDLHLEGNTLWIGTENDGLHRLDVSTGRWLASEALTSSGTDTTTPDPGPNNINGLARAEEGLWVGSWDSGLWHLDFESGQFAQHPAISGVDVLDVVEGPEGQVWVSVWREGARLLDASGELVLTASPDGDITTVNDRVVAIEAGDGYVWIGGWNGIELVNTETGTVSAWSANSGRLVGDVVFDILDNNDGTAWLATSGGLEFLDSNASRSVYYGPKAGLPTTEALQLARHRELPALWIATNQGLALFDTQRLEVVRVLTTKDGLDSNSFSQFGSAVADDGTIYISSASGLVAVPPTAGSSVKVNGSLFITSVVVDDLGVAPTSSLTLDKPGTVRFDFSVPEFDAPEAIRYRHRLKGADDDWVNGGRSAVYVDLRPGDYEFEVEASVAGGFPIPLVGWPEDGSVSLVVTTPIWQRTWFIVFYSFAGLSLAVVMGRRYTTRLQLRRRAQELEVEVSARTSEIADYARRAEDASESRTRFLSMVSHELRSPLTTVVGFTELIANDPRNERVEFWARRANDAGGHLGEMIEDLLEITRKRALESGTSPDLVSIRRFLSQTARIGQGTEIAPTTTLIDIEGDLADEYLLPKKQVRQVLINLLDNANKYGDSSAVIVRAERVDTDGGLTHQVTFSVIDYGVGIPADEIEQVFTPFFRGRQSTGDGIGLGLAIASQVVEALGSRLEVESRSGESTTFSFTIALSAVVSTAEQSVTGLPSGKILVVDDDPRSREVLAETLKGDYEVAAAASGEEALHIFRRFRPNLVITDHSMPVMSGAELAQELHQLDNSVSVMCITALPDEAEKCDSYETVIGKPFNGQRLRGIVRDHVGRSP